MKIRFHKKLQKKLAKLDDKKIKKVSNFIDKISLSDSFSDLLSFNQPIVKLKESKKNLYILRMSKSMRMVFSYDEDENSILILDIIRPTDDFDLS